MRPISIGKISAVLIIIERLMVFYDGINVLIKYIKFLPMMLCAIFPSTLIVYLFSPGFISYDTIIQYGQVIGDNQVTGDHPEIMYYLWVILMKIIPAPESMLIAQQVFYWFGILILSFFIFSSNKKRFVSFVFIGIWPPLLLYSIHIWKDAGMFIAMMVSVGAILADIKRKSVFWIVIACTCLFYAFSVRHNAILGVVPIMLFLSWRIVSRFNVFLFHKFIYTSFCFSFLCLVFFGVKHSISVSSDNQVGIQSILLWDMAAISVKEKKNIFPNFIVADDNGLVLSQLNNNFNKNVNVPTFSIISLHGNYTKLQLLDSWYQSVINYPYAYLSHRGHIFGALLGLNSEGVFYPYHRGVEPNEYGITFNGVFSQHQEKLFSFLDKMSSYTIYKPWPYLLACLFVLVMATIQLYKLGSLTQVGWLSAVVSFSGLTMTLPLFIIATAADYRYMIWGIAAGVISILLQLDDRSEQPAAISTSNSKS